MEVLVVVGAGVVCDGFPGKVGGCICVRLSFLVFGRYAIYTDTNLVKFNVHLIVLLAFSVVLSVFESPKTA